jgi:hypothetical protein
VTLNYSSPKCSPPTAKDSFLLPPPTFQCYFKTFYYLQWLFRLREAFIPKGVLRPLFTIFLFIFLFKIVKRRATMDSVSVPSKRTERWNAGKCFLRSPESALDAYNRDLKFTFSAFYVSLFEISCRKCSKIERHGGEQDQTSIQMFYDLVLWSVLLHHFLTIGFILYGRPVRIRMEKISFCSPNWFLMYNHEARCMTKDFRNPKQWETFSERLCSCDPVAVQRMQLFTSCTGWQTNLW